MGSLSTHSGVTGFTAGLGFLTLLFYLLPVAIFSQGSSLENELTFSRSVVDSVLTLEPEIRSSTYLGGASNDRVWAVFVDPEGNILLAGSTESEDFPTTNILNPPRLDGFNQSDGFVVKLDPTGTRLIFSSSFGGSDSDTVTALALDSKGGIYIAGGTRSTDFPVRNALQTQHGNTNSSIKSGDAFVAKLNPSGSSLIYATYLGGDHGDSAAAIAVDEEGCVVVVGDTSSPNFPTKAALQATCSSCLHGASTGPRDLYVLKLSSDGGELIFSTFLGGSHREKAYDAVVDGEGNIYVAGTTLSTDYPLSDPLQPELQGETDGLISVLKSDGSELAFSTFLGGSALDIPTALALGKAGEIHVAGYTDSTDYPVRNSVQPQLATLPERESLDGFVSKFSGDRSQLSFSTYFGGTGSDGFSDLVLTEGGLIVLSGFSSSSDLPTKRAFQPCQSGRDDALIARIDPFRGKLTYASCLGGRSGDSGEGIALDQEGNPVLVGLTSSLDFPVLDPFQEALGRGRSIASGGNWPRDIFLTRILHMKKYFFAQFGAGRGPAGSLSGLMLLGNLEAAKPASVLVEILDNDAVPMTIDLGETIVRGRGEATIPPAGLLRLRSGLLEPVQTGSLTITSDQELSAGFLFGGSFGLAGIPNSQPIEAFSAPIEVNSRTNTGIALMGFEVSQTVQLALRSSDGNLLGRTTEILGANSHVARFVTDFSWDSEIDFSEFQGVLTGVGTTEYAATVIQTFGRELLTMPVINLDPFGRAERTVLLFPQFVDGPSIQSGLRLIPLGDQPAEVTVEIYRADGDPMTVDLNGQTITGTLSLVVPVNGAGFLQTDGAGPLQNGFVIVRAEQPVRGVIKFTSPAGAAGLGSSARLRDFLTPVRSGRGARSGIALVALDVDLALELELRNTNGESVATTVLSLDANNQAARLIADLTWDRPVDFSDFVGTLSGSAASDFAAIAIRLDSGKFAALPLTSRVQ